MSSLDIRQATLKALKMDGIQATFHYVPLHSSPFGRSTLRCTDELPVTERCSETLIRLPMYPQLHTQADTLAARVAKIVQKELAVSI